MARKLFECEITDEDELVLRLRVPSFEGVLPDTRKHLRSARKELLLALRGLVDAALAGEPGHAEGRRTITVE